MNNLFKKGTRFALLITTSLLAISPVQAKDNTKIEIKNLESGRLVFSKGPVLVEGSASDPEGVKKIYATVQDAETQMFATVKGKFVKKPVQLPVHLSKRSSDMLWTTNKLRLPDGNYIFRMRVEDNGRNRSRIVGAQIMVGQGNERRRAAEVVKAQPQRQQQQQQQQTAASQTVRPAAGVAANGMPYCSNAGMDPDKDGYGWENEKSCVVMGSKADKHPNCASAASDPDGDGWGWENERSCIVVTNCQNANSDPDGDGWGWENNKSCIVVKTSSKHPPCQSSASDPDGDGYGWENNATCLVAK